MRAPLFTNVDDNQSIKKNRKTIKSNIQIKIKNKKIAKTINDQQNKLPN
jgi:hypothetical protein